MWSSKLLNTLILTLAGLSLAAPAMAYEVTEADIAKQVRRHVLEQLKADENTTVGIDILRVPGMPMAIESANSADELQYHLTSTLGESYSSRTIVRVQVTGPDDDVRTIGVPIKLTIQKKVWVAKAKVTPKEELSTALFAIEERDVSQNYQTVIGAETELKQYEARIILKPGQVLDSRSVVLPPAVRRYSDVRIIMTNHDGLNITLKGLALEDGRVGETVKVRHPIYRHKVYTAKVIDRNRVEVEI
jgi:flagella basal body P-ring formation protein FlgA